MGNEWEASASMTGSPKNGKQISSIPINRLHAFEGHPYKVLDNEEMDSLTESVLENGILTPLLVRPIEGATDEYEVISGHRRLRAAKRAGLETVPAFVYDVDRDDAAILLVDSNLHREHILPSEKAFAYKLKMEALNHQGQACGQVGHKSRDTISETESGRTVQRYIRLTHLIPPLLDLVDEGRIAFSVGVELSYLDSSAQEHIAEIVACDEITPSFSQAVRMHREKSQGFESISDERIDEIMSEEKPNQREMVKIRADRLRAVLPSGVRGEQAEAFILKACEHYRRYLQRSRDAR